MHLNLQFPNKLTDGHYRLFRDMIRNKHVGLVATTETSAHYEALTRKGQTFFTWLKLTQGPEVS